LAGRVTTLIPLRASMEFTPDQPVIQNRTWDFQTHPAPLITKLN
jgi:hypothetical protein